MTTVTADQLRTAKVAERSSALQEVLRHAQELGLEKALEQFGRPLSGTDVDAIRALTPEELETLAVVDKKLAPLEALRLDNNFNFNEQ